jgi:hypothetical protein
MEIKVVQHYNDMDEKCKGSCDCVDIFIDGIKIKSYNAIYERAILENLQSINFKTEKIADIYFEDYPNEEEETA